MGVEEGKAHIYKPPSSSTNLIDVDVGKPEQPHEYYHHEHPEGRERRPLLFDINNRVCRNCHDDQGDDFIAPCNCAGSMQWVHRRCLDEWRSVSPNPDSFYRCDVCHFNYQFREVRPGEESCCNPKLKVFLLIMRDLLIGVILWQALVWLCTLIAWSAGFHAFELLENWHADWLAKDYVGGLLLFFFIVGMTSILTMCYAMCCSSESHEEATYRYTYSSYPYSYSWWECYWMSRICVDCSFISCHHHHHGGHCGGNCSGNCDARFLLILVAIIIAIGLIVAVFVAVAMIFKLVAYRSSVQKKRVDAKSISIVVDLSENQV